MGLYSVDSPGLKASYIRNPDTDPVELISKVTVQLKPGEIMSYRTCGGGGYGPPEERNPNSVCRDVREGKVSLERARGVYKVAVDTQLWTVDEAETETLRSDGRGGLRAWDLNTMMAGIYRRTTRFIRRYQRSIEMCGFNLSSFTLNLLPFRIFSRNLWKRRRTDYAWLRGWRCLSAQTMVPSKNLLL